MPTYTFLAADLRTNAILAELPFTQVKLENRLNGAGPLTASLPLDDPKISKIDPFTATEKGRTALYVDRDGVLIWGGVIWTRGYSSRTGLLNIGATEFWSYFQRRRIAVTKTYTAQDQMFIARDLINYAQGVGGGNIGVVVGSETSAVLRNTVYNGYEFRTLAAEILTLSQLQNGFDFAIDLSYVAGVPTKTLRLSYPRRGTAAISTGWMFELPGNVYEYSYPEDGSKMANTVYGIGAGNGAAMMTSMSAVTSQIDQGYPLLEDSVTDKGISDQAVLGAKTQAAATSLAQPVILPQITVSPSQDPVLGSYITGDELRLRITDQRFPTTLDVYARITGIAVQPPDSGNAETVTLMLGPVF